MYRSELCNTYLLERNKTKRYRSQKQKLYSNLMLNCYVIEDVEVAKFEDVLGLYISHPSGNMDFFTVGILLREYDREIPFNHKEMCQITSLITFKVNIIRPTQQNQLASFYIELYHFIFLTSTLLK